MDNKCHIEIVRNYICGGLDCSFFEGKGMNFCQNAKAIKEADRKFKIKR